MLKKTISTLICILLTYSQTFSNTNFKDFFKARTLLSFYENNPDIIDKIDYRNFEKYHDINMGFNNYKKHIFFINCYERNKELGKLKNELRIAVKNGLCYENIPLKVRENRKLFSIKEYNSMRKMYLKGIDYSLKKMLLAIQDSDQLYRTSLTERKELWETQIKLDENNFSTLKELTIKHGWLWALPFDEYNNSDTIGYSLHPIISHFKREQIEYFLNIAIELAKRNEISWDEAVVLQHAILWRHSIYYNRDEKYQIFPLDKITIHNDGHINWNEAYFQLFVLGKVTLCGLKKMEIELFCKNELLKTNPKVLEDVKLYWRFLGVENTIRIGKYQDNSILDTINCSVFYRVTKIGSGALRWFEPYRLMIF